MSIQRFQAPTTREALALARAAFGDGTLILSNRQLPDGVEVTAASEETLSALDANQDRAPRTVAPMLAAPARPTFTAAATPVPASAPTASAASRQTVQADTEALAMSTLSFQDYVRERMVRRQSEQLGQATMAPPLEPMSGLTTAVAPMPAQVPVSARAPAPAPSPTPAPVPAAPVAQQRAAAILAAIQAADAVDIDLPAEAVAQAAELAPQPAAAEPMQTRWQPQDNDQSNVLAELHAMKQMMEERFNVLAWSGQARKDPVHSNLMLKLVRAGYSPTLARAVLEPITLGQEPSDSVREVMAALQARVATDADGPSMAQEGGVFAFIGATGVGKTTSVAKLAAQCEAMHGAASVGLVTLDVHRAGAHEQLRGYARSIGVVAHLAHDGAALAELLTLLSMKKIVLIDTAGVAPRDPRRAELLEMLDLPQIKPLLVLNAGAQGDTLDDIATHFRREGARQAIVTKVDEAVKLGPVLDTVMRHELVLRGVANGQRVPQDWAPADARELVRASMRATERSAFDPRTADLDFYFSPAACAA